MCISARLTNECVVCLCAYTLRSETCIATVRAPLDFLPSAEVLRMQVEGAEPSDGPAQPGLGSGVTACASRVARVSWCAYGGLVLCVQVLSFIDVTRLSADVRLAGCVRLQ